MEHCRKTRSNSNFTALILMALLGAAATFALTAESENDGMPLKIAQDPNALASIPPDLVPKTGWPPLWIDARAIELTPEGKLDLEKPTPLGPPTTWRQLFASYQPGRWGPRGWEAQETRGCHPIGTIWVDEVFPPSRSSLARTIETVETVVFGRVVGKSYGFYRGMPGQLIKIAPLKTFGLSPRSKRHAFFFSMPVGEFQVGNERICKSDIRYATPPEVGEEVFVFVRPPAGENHDVLDVHDAGEVVPIRPDGTASLPGEHAPNPARAASFASGLRTKEQLLDALGKRTDR